MKALWAMLAAGCASWAAPATLGRVAEARQERSVHRVWRLRGTVTLLPGTLTTYPNSFYIQDETGGLSIASGVRLRLTYYDRVEVEGSIRRIEDDEPDLVATRVTVLENGPRAQPRVVSVSEALRPEASGLFASLRGIVRKSSIGVERDDVFLEGDNRVLRIYFRRPPSLASVLPTQAPVGAEIEVRGVLLPSAGEGNVLRLRDSVDLRLVRAPSVWRSPLFWIILLSVVAALALAGGLILLLRRAINQQTSEIRKLLTKAEEASRLKSEFLANLSHEIRTPIHGIQGMHALLRESPLNGQQAEELGMAEESTCHLLSLLDDVLDLSKIEAGRMTLENAPFNPEALVRGTVRSFLLRAREKGLLLECRVDEVPSVVTGDATRLRQVLYNLLSNAIKFTDSGKVAVEARTAEQTFSGGRLEFRVSDTGIGIPPESQAAIFESFRQVDGTISRRYGGSGLGLAIAHQLVTLMDGHLTVRSAPGEGSVFEFSVPFGRPAVTDRPGPVETAVPSPPPMKVLVAEDNEVNQRLVLRMLEKDGHAVTVVGDGDAALQALERGPFDVVLMDVQMPGKDGLQAVREYRQREQATETGRLPIFALTAHSMPSDFERCLEAGMDAYLVKPFTPDQLRGLLAQAHCRDRAAQPLDVLPPG